jgi:hypothetical protein
MRQVPITVSDFTIMRRTLLLSSLYVLALTILALPYGMGA